ncbi:MAG: SIS domain-containing protein, partial [Actinomycetota bacterium]|nr:SIS domain-containing protein [Actinomycetota bacterium]
MRPTPNGHGDTKPAARSLSDDQSRSDDLATLYPFLYAHPKDVGQTNSGAGNLETVLAEVRRSTVEKVHEIVALRREVLAQESQRLAACASAMAEAFANGGRLFAIGNGGSCTDAAD